MTGTIHALAASVPGYCTSGTGVRTPAQWATCAKLGWSQPTTGAANAGAAAGHYVAPALLIGVIIGVILLVMSRSGKTAPQGS